MKRKRGNKKGKAKKKPTLEAASNAVPDVVNLMEDNSGLDENDDDNDIDEVDRGTKAETPSSTGTEPPEKLVSVNSGGLVDNSAPRLVYGRVKVKIRNSKALDSHITSSEAPTQSDTDKSSQQVGLEKQGVVSEKMEDSANSLPEINPGGLGIQSMKAGSIKIKSSLGFSSSSFKPCNNAGAGQGEKTYQKEPELPRRENRYNKQELDVALEVIKKIMKMDAAEPFNVPVNPVALGIPDYFEVIDTPMDFGTICNNLENGLKYMNSEDVYKDVQYIWENCYKYNNKGDYIVELMKRVKKNFAKYWLTVGLYSEQPQGVESSHEKDVAPSSHGKTPAKGVQLQLKQKTRRRHGVKKHKDDCLCAICIMMRRRQEREENAQNAEDQIENSDSLLVQDVKTMGTSPESPCNGDSSSNMDNSVGPDADADLEDKDEVRKLEHTKQYHSLQEKQEEDGKENDMALQTKQEGDTSGHSHLGDRSGEEHSRQYEVMEPGGDFQNGTQNEEISMQHDYETAAVEHQKSKESSREIQKLKMYENLRCFQNPMLWKLCGSLFADDDKSFWNGTHSLVQREGSRRISSIDAAVATFMK